MKMRGARILVEALRCEGVEHIFGYPGGAVLHVYDEINRHEDRIKHYLVRHEQGALFAAAGYAQATGKTGVALVTSGPGGTNAVTGIANAFMDSIPVVVFTGQVPTHLIGNDAFQEADLTGITRSCTKHNYLVKHVEELAPTIKEAFYVASSGRPGPVLIDMPKDMTAQEAEFRYPETINMRSYKPTLQGHPGQVRRAVELMLRARRPVLYVGGGAIAAGAHEEVRRLAEKLNLPTTCTLMGLGTFPASHPLSLGMLGMHGGYWTNMAVDNSDLLISIGARFDDRVTGKLDQFARGAQIIHVDIDPSCISKNVKADVPVVGDARVVVQQMLAEVERQLDAGERIADRTAWFEQIQEWKRQHPFFCHDEGEVIKPQRVIEELHRLTGGRAIVSADVGQHQMWTAQLYGFENPRQWLNSGGLGAMGYGFPAAMGAAVARPGEQVVAVVGDGGFQMSFNELATIVEYDIPVKILIINNGYLGMVRQWQEQFYARNYSHSNIQVAPDFVKLAEAYGVRALRATQASEVSRVLAEGLEARGPVLMEMQVNREENVFPIVPAGAALKEMILG
ncbi:MAG: biosynthetic-type acetolactate synthase large subunit [Acidobacteria bacterium]|nr:biosynthetic-type acetolactate synthase large subunit [Acidobacteriota bacterium]MCW5969891.1 biosynthetic-type acetolactate synthase large subunit [Blastocatellales bacterium]